MKSYDFKVNGQSFTARIIEYTDTKVIVDLNGNNYEVEMTSETSAAPVAPAPQRPAPTPRNKVKKPQSPPTAGSSGPGTVAAPIPGVVKQIMVSVGDQVKKDTVVLLLEAMKMENQITAGVDGTITQIAVDLGDSVDDGQTLIQIEAS
jgi:biotin carboxyl carrier protein